MLYSCPSALINLSSHTLLKISGIKLYLRCDGSGDYHIPLIDTRFGTQVSPDNRIVASSRPQTVPSLSSNTNLSVALLWKV